MITTMCKFGLECWKRFAGDHLEGGKYFSPSPELLEKASSTPDTNDFMESCFGLAKFFAWKSPHMALDNIEGLVMYKKNYTEE